MKFSLRSARTHYRNGEYGPAVANYMAILKLVPANVSTLEKEFLVSFEKFIQQLESAKKIEQVNEYFTLVSELYPSSPRFLKQWGEFLARQSLYEEAALCFMKSLDSYPDYEDARRSLRNLCSGLVDRWHFRMLNDHQRNAAYEQALSVCLAKAQFTSPIMVLDIGCGTGILSMLALEAGAQKVVACEVSTIMCQMAKKIFAENGIMTNNELKLIEKHSKDLDLMEDFGGNRPQVIVTELMDAGFFGEGIVGTILDAKKRLLAPTGMVIPSKAKIWVALIECETIRRSNYVMVEGIAEKDAICSSLCSAIPTSSSARTEPVDKTHDYPKRLEPYTAIKLNKIKGGFRYLSKPLILDEIDLNDESDLSRHEVGFNRRLNITINDSGFLDAIACWFEVDMLPASISKTPISVCTNPENVNTSWEQAVFPIVFTNLKRQVGDTVELELEIRDNWMQCSICLDEAKDGISTVSGKDEYKNLVDSTSLIELINDNFLANLYHTYFIHEQQSTATNSPIIDLTDNPRLASLSSIFNHTAVSVYSNSDTKMVAQHFLGRDQNGKSIMVDSIDDAEASINDGHTFDTLLVCPVDTCGLLKQNVLEDIAFCRLRFDIQMIVPSMIHIFGFLIESDELERCARVTADENTLGFKIKDVINIFETDIQRDIELSTLNYKQLTLPTKLMTLNLLEPLPDRNDNNLPQFLKQTTRTSLETITEGMVHALIFWYEFANYGETQDGGHFSTADPRTHFLVAASIANPFVVSNDDLVSVTTTLDRSELNFNMLLVNLAEI